MSSSPLRVLHVLSGLAIGGMERAVIRLASRGVREGMQHELVLFDTPFRSDATDYDPGDLVTRFIARQPGIDLRFAFNLARQFAEAEVDIIHAHNQTAIFYSALATVLFSLNRSRLIATFRTRPAGSTIRARLSTRWAANRASTVVAVSQEMNDWLVQHGWARKCSTIWNGIDSNEFSDAGSADAYRTRLRIPANAILVGHVGRFSSIKRHIDLFDAASRLQREEPPLYFAFAGDGPLFTHFEKLSSNLPNVFLLSNVKDVAAFLRSLDIFVLCSEHEGTPQALLEAMACKRAIIATGVGGVPYVLDAGGPLPAGRIIPPLRPDRLAEEIVLLARDGKLRAKLARTARERVKAFSFDSEWGQYAKLYTATAN